MKKSYTKVLSVLLSLAMALSLCVFPVFAVEAEEHDHAEVCGDNIVQANAVLCPHANTYILFEGEDIYANESSHDSYEVVKTYCQDCGKVLNISRQFDARNPHNSRNGYYVQSMTHSSDGAWHFTVYRRICTCGYSYDTVTKTACNCPK